MIVNLTHAQTCVIDCINAFEAKFASTSCIMGEWFENV